MATTAAPPHPRRRGDRGGRGRAAQGPPRLGRHGRGILLLLTPMTSLTILFVLLADVMAERCRCYRLAASISSPRRTARTRLSRAWGRAIVGSIILTAFVIILALLIGITAAVYLEEYAGDNRFARLVNTNIRNLAGSRPSSTACSAWPCSSRPSTAAGA